MMGRRRSQTRKLAKSVDSINCSVGICCFMLSPFTVLYFDVKLRDGILQWVLKNQMRCPLLDTVEFKNLRRLLKRTRHIKIEVCDLQFSVGSSCHHNSKSCDFTLLFCRGRHGIVLKYARAARLFFVIQPIKVSICGVVVAFPAVDAKAP